MIESSAPVSKILNELIMQRGLKSPEFQWHLEMQQVVHRRFSFVSLKRIRKAGLFSTLIMNFKYWNMRDTELELNNKNNFSD